MKLGRGSAAWLRRGLLAVVLVGAAIIPGRASSLGAQHCTGLSCRTAGSILWTRALPGSWVAEPGVSGTVPGAAPAYAAAAGGIAVVAAGTLVTAFAVATGKSRWQVSTAGLAGLPADSVIVGVRAFAQEVAVGVEPAATADSGTGTGTGVATGRDEVILSAATGQMIRSYPAGAYGGAIAADATATVVVGIAAVTAYSNATGRVLWRRATGPAGQTWRVSGAYVYVTETAAGYVDASQVTALRRISLSTGAERIVSPHGTPFGGTLTAVIDDVAIFSGSSGVQAFSASTGEPVWQRSAGVLELADAGNGTVYLAEGASLDGVSVATGSTVSKAAASVAGSLYSVTSGVAVGLDQNALGDAWGYSLSTRKIVWTSAGLPWPHYFIDLSGLGGSVSPGSDVLLLASCARVGRAANAASPPSCQRPELSAVRL